MIRLYIVRHGETEWNRERRAMGRKEIPLNRKGLEDAEKVAELLKDKGIKAIYTSPLRRTVETAEAIGRKTGANVIRDERLIEIGIRPWEGRSFNELLKDDGYRSFLEDPDGRLPEGVEPAREVQKRGLELIRDIVANHSQGSFVLVSHADVIRPILCHYLHIPLKYMRSFNIDNASISVVEIGEKRSRVLLLNYKVEGIP